MNFAGIGLRQDATVTSLKSALDAAQAKDIAVLATPADKADHPALTALAAELGMTIIAVSHKAMTAQTTLTQSQRVSQKRGTGSVAEAAALAAAGPGGKLQGPRAVSDDRMATCAIATGAAQ